MPGKKIKQKTLEASVPYLQESEVLFHDFVQQSIDGIILIDSQGVVVEWNASMEKLSGFRSKDILGLKAWEMQLLMDKTEEPTPERRNYLETSYMNILYTGMVPETIQTIETNLVRKDGQQTFIEQKIFVVRTSEGNWIGVIARDLTERENFTKKLEAQNAELEILTYTLSHDLKSPLVTIKGYLGYLMEDIKSGNLERLAHDKQRIINAVDKMNSLLNDLLELSRLGRVMNPPERVAFEVVVAEATELVRGQLQKRGATIIVHPNLPIVSGDKRRLVQVMQNLLDNAIKFMGEQKSPKIVIDQRGEKDGNSIFIVKDNGIGIAPEHHERVFGLFNKLDPKSEDTGVGLAIVKRIIEFHGGTVWVESEAGKGCTFYFTLPRG